MEVITTHTNADFDAIASLVAAGKLFPNAKKVLSGGVENAVKTFLAENPCGIVKSRSINLSDINKLILVDTRQLGRIGKFSQVVKNIPVLVFDHHPNQPDDIQKQGIIKEYGATITILLELLRKKRIKILPEEANLFCLGIYEDTGFLTFPTTKEEDVKTVLWLLKNKADLSRVTSYLKHEPTKDEIFLLAKLLSSVKIYRINNIDIALAKTDASGYTGEFAVIAHKMMDIENFPVLFLLIKKGDCVHVVARSRGKIDVGSVLSDFGGGGHPQAGSCTIKNVEILTVKRKLISRIKSGQRNLWFLIDARAGKVMRNLIEKARMVADSMDVFCYVIGGFVRDIIIGEIHRSLDLLIVGDGVEFAKRFSSLFPKSHIALHHRFKTANITLEDGTQIDIATSRSETYKRPGALPDVKAASLKKDLKRRDFTINTLAVLINKKYKGRLVDIFSGMDDIKERKIRILHPKSFIDDPTRIFRAIRFESRLGFRMDTETEKMAKESINMNALSHISRERIRNELFFILSDERPQRALVRLKELGVLSTIYPRLSVDEKGFMDAYDAFLQISIFGEEIDISIINLMVLTDKLSSEELENFLSHLKFKVDIKKKLKEIRKKKGIVTFLRRKYLKNSEIYEKLKDISIEGLIYLMSKTKNKLVKKRIFLFLTSLKDEKIYLSGDDLKAFGIKPGPIYRKLLKNLFHLKLDGVIKTRDDEIKYVLEKNSY
ncbi:TPA: hypothetical protein DCX16_06690 [bacterium]|nr:hypothetical protein [bacterium]